MRPLVRPLLAGAVGVPAARCHEAPVTAPQPITSLPRQLSVAEHGLIAADNQFAFKLFREIARQAGPDSNLFISPLSAAMALGMAYNGAGGATRDEMQRALQLDGMTLDDVNQSYRSLIALLRGLDPRVAFTLANSVWYRQQFNPLPGFLDATRNYFDATVESLDFASPAAAPTIDRKSTRLNSSHGYISYAVFCLKKKKTTHHTMLLQLTHNKRQSRRTVHAR